MNRSLKKVVVGAIAAVGAASFAAGPADAQPVTQRGLVNVNLSDVAVSIPIALAANVCDVNVAVLVDTLEDAAAPCTASADPTSEITLEGGGPVSQQGLVNVNVTNLVVAVPIGIAANICDVNVGVLIGDLRDAAADCDATATPDAITTIGG